MRTRLIDRSNACVTSHVPMPRLPLPLPAALLLALIPGGAPAQRGTVRSAQFVMQEQVIVRLPRLPGRVQAAAPVVWVEGKKGPKCIALATLAGALITQPRSVDLVQLGGARVRAQIDKRCPSLDYYSGFYLKPTADGMICAGRDPVRTRGGRACEIARFRTLVAKR